MKRSVLIFLAVAMTVSIATLGMATPPIAKIESLGVSPRDVAADSMDIYDQQATGLFNVGKGETVYLRAHGAEKDSIIGYAWQMTARPAGSNAALNANDVQTVKFLADTTGIFRISLVVTSDSGQSEAVLEAVSAGTWVGTGHMGDPTRGQCAMCHGEDENDKVAKWSETKHATMFETMITGARGAYRSFCVSCHTVGYNVRANNNGFDDVATAEGWRFPDSLRDTTWNSIVQNFPRTAAMANIQCENCHGPGSAHNANTNDNRIDDTFDVGVCAKCHDSGTHHFRPMQWKLSGHSRQPIVERSGCANCHSGIGFVDKLSGMVDSLVTRDYQPIGCTTCHDPHDDTNPYQLRTVAPYMLLDSTVVDYGNGNLCVNCHHARRIGTPAQIAGRNPRLNPHGSPQGDMLAGKNAFTYGQQIRSTPHAGSIENVCVGCHMAPTPEDANNQATYLKLGDHTFHVKTETGEEQIETCQECHEGVQSFDAIMPRDNEDWDSDGTRESVTAEIAGLMERIDDMLPPAGPGFTFDTTWTDIQRMAAFNYNFVLNDGSRGLHNPKYAKGILQAALAGLGVTPINPGTVPMAYALSEAYPNPFNPSTTINFSLAKSGHASIKVFDMAGREIATVISGEFNAGNYRTPIVLTSQPSGVYVLRMQAGTFDASRKLVLVK
jgi:hypothetical protein